MSTEPIDGPGDKDGIPQSLRNTGQANLEKARFFATHVEDIEDGESPEVERAEAFLDAAIVFGKATQDWLADRYGRPWLKQSRLWNDPICKFFADMRDVVIHEDGSVQTVSRTHVTAYTRPAVMLASGNVVVMQTIPTNRSLPVRLWVRWLNRLEKVRARRLQRKLERERRQRLARLREEAAAKAGSHPEAGQFTHFHFVHDDPIIAGPSALRVVNDYLDLLESVMVEAQVGYEEFSPLS